ncbi:arginine-tRNA-protein transferase [Fomitopsis serialis]|uniref:arginine-tRNA-protein transferase n=1 Tax=Fomitopsis serialis TaxID=139415 RepID=UPI00200812EF|nr:arginine-tRNA-protein transferase [Neoantrodia serialis]KAH9938554.1 arginine-tRNA-protein transferase [Neoantrodia serialis]
MERTVSILSPLTPHNSTCGYCSPPGRRSETKSNWHAAECIPLRMSCEAYQKMIDRGWRRSGTYCYKPDLKKSCCPQYTIKLDAHAFKLSRSQRKLLNRWNRFVLHGEGGEDALDEAGSKPKQGNAHKGKKTETALSLTDYIHASDYDFCETELPEHRFEESSSR